MKMGLSWWSRIHLPMQGTRVPSLIWELKSHMLECKLVQPLRKTEWWFLKKLGTELPYGPAIPLLGTHTEETRTERDTCTPVFTVALFTTARTWKPPRCPSADEWIRKLWCIYTVEYYSAIKEHIWVSSNEVDETGAYYTEWSQKEKHKYCILTHIHGI